MSLCPLLASLLLLLGAKGFLSLELDSLQEVGPVVFASVLFRHGDRTPIEFYPNDPYKNASFWPEGPAQLTNRGKMREYSLGKWLRKHYRGLLSAKYSNIEVFVRSTDVDRCLMSGEMVLAGLYPPSPDQVWSHDLRWQPIPVHTTPEHEDKLLAMKAPCKKYDVEYKKAMSESPVKEWNDKYKELFEYVSEHSGNKVTDLTLLEYVYSGLFIEDGRNLTLPAWTKRVYPEPMRTAAAYSFALQTVNTQLKRLKSGPLLKEIIDNMVKKRDGRLDRKVTLYSGHDTTVSNLLNTLGLYTFVNPPFSSAVLIELRTSPDKNYFVNVVYKNDSGGVVLELGGCGKVCPLDLFLDLTKDLLPQDWTAECHLHNFFDITSDLPYSVLTIFAMVTSTMLVFLLLASGSIFWQRRSSSSHLYRKLDTDTI